MHVYLDTTGCRLNQSEIDAMARQFRQAGHTVVLVPDRADLIVVNTCAVTREATRTSRRLIRRLHGVNAQAPIVATGCYASLAAGDAAALPAVAQVVSNLDKDRLVPIVLGTDADAAQIDTEPLERDQAAGAGGRTRAFVKVQDGCDNRCTFCVTTIARGPGRSRPLDDVVQEVAAFAAAGYQEAVLTGVHLGSYGHDRGERTGLLALLRALLERTDIRRLRVSSLEPWDVTEELFALWEDPRLCRHLHLPLQSGCDATLKRMARRTSQASFGALVKAARVRIPDVAISTDVIVGFPGETAAEFEQSASFVGAMDFMKLHVFRYSARPGTAAARLPGQVPSDIAKERSAQLVKLSVEGNERFRRRLVGRAVDVLWEQVTGASPAGFHNSGLTDHYVRVAMVAPRALTNSVERVRVVELSADGVRATPVAAVVGRD